MRVDGRTSAWLAARAILHERGDELFRRTDKVLATFDPDDIHDLRVASRRLREALALFAPCYSPERIGRIDRRVRKVTRLLGEMRNTDEAHLFFSRLAGELDAPCRGALEPFIASLREKRERETGRLADGLRKMAGARLRGLYRRSMNSLSLFIPREDGADPFAPFSGFARDALDVRFSAVVELVPRARQHGAIEAQHRLRIAVKHFRYRVELLSFLFGTGYPQLHAALKGYQDVLGKMHDLDVFAGLVREAHFPPAAERAILHAIIAEREKLFRDFSAMLVERPLDEIGARVRNAL